MRRKTKRAKLQLKYLLNNHKKAQAFVNHFLDISKPHPVDDNNFEEFI